MWITWKWENANVKPNFTLWAIWIINRGGEILYMDEQIGLNPCSSLLMLSKVTQWFNGAPIPTFFYTIDTVKAICAKAFLQDPVNVGFLNEYDCVLEFATNFDLHKITMTLQK